MISGGPNLRTPGVRQRTPRTPGGPLFFLLVCGPLHYFFQAVFLRASLPFILEEPMPRGPTLRNAHSSVVLTRDLSPYVAGSYGQS